MPNLEDVIFPEEAQNPGHMTHLRSKQEYINRYDRITVDDCRQRESFHKNYQSPNFKTEEEIALRKMVSDVAIYFDLFFAKLYWWERKEETIRKWMDEDAHKDALLESAHAPQGIRCLKCHAPITATSKTIYDLDHKGDRVLFFYDCPNGCLPRRAFFSDGEEYRPKKETCSKCGAEVTETHARTGNKITTTYTCPQCGHIAISEIDLTPRKEEIDPDFDKDRERFCLTEESGREALQERLRIDQMSKLAEGWKEKESRKEEHDAIAKIQKLNVLDLEKLLAPILEKEGYVRLQFGIPEIAKSFILPFSVYDNKTGRTDLASSHDLTRLVKKSLDATNWRLMSDGISYRLGYLTGRMRAYEREEDLLELVSRKSNKEAVKRMD